MELHVAKSGSDTAAGTAQAPLLTIGAARGAQSSATKETVVVHEGVYREWVNPPARRYGCCADREQGGLRGSGRGVGTRLRDVQLHAGNLSLRDGESKSAAGH